MDNWDPFAEETARQGAIDQIVVGGVEIRPGVRVKLRPRGRADIFDIALGGKIATVVSIEQDFENRIYLAVTVDDDPGSDFGQTGKPGHRFFFGVDEIETVADAHAPIE